MAGAIVVSRTVHLAAHGVTVLGPVPRGLPGFTLPTLQLHDAVALLGTAASIGIVILAQSAATARAYAVKHDEPMDTDTDLTGLGAANVAAAFTGTFVVNGSPTKTQIVDDAGGRSQLASLTTGAIAVVVLLVATGPLRYLPDAALAAVVFLIGAELMDVRGLHRLRAVRRGEFAVAVLTAAAVVGAGRRSTASGWPSPRRSSTTCGTATCRAATCWSSRPPGTGRPPRWSPARRPCRGWSCTGSAPACTSPTRAGSWRT